MKPLLLLLAVLFTRRLRKEPDAELLRRVRARRPSWAVWAMRLAPVATVVLVVGVWVTVQPRFDAQETATPAKTAARAAAEWMVAPARPASPAPPVASLAPAVAKDEKAPVTTEVVADVTTLAANAPTLTGGAAAAGAAGARSGLKPPARQGPPSLATAPKPSDARERAGKGRLEAALRAQHSALLKLGSIGVTTWGEQLRYSDVLGGASEADIAKALQGAQGLGLADDRSGRAMGAGGGGGVAMGSGLGGMAEGPAAAAGKARVLREVAEAPRPTEEPEGSVSAEEEKAEAQVAPDGDTTASCRSSERALARATTPTGRVDAALALAECRKRAGASGLAKKLLEDLLDDTTLSADDRARVSEALRKL